MELGCLPVPMSPVPAQVPRLAHQEMSRCLGWLLAGVPTAQRGLSLHAGTVHGVGTVSASRPSSPELAHGLLSQR